MRVRTWTAWVPLVGGCVLLLLSTAAPGGPAKPQRQPVSESPIAQDPRLQATLTADLKEPKLDDVLQALRQATGLALKAASDIDRDRPVLGSLSLRNEKAWRVMAYLARSPVVQGHWEESDGGYRLVGRGGESGRAGFLSSIGLKPLHVFVAVNCVGAAAVGCWLVVRGLRRKPDPVAGK